MARKGIRIALLAVMVGLCILIVMNLISASPSGNAGNANIFVWTKAICNERNYCLDVLITCINGQVADLKPQGEGVYFSGSWRDPRPEESRLELC
jgi:hypothetical protein